MTRQHPLLELVAVMDRLRSPGGCPWDAEQTHRSLVEYLLEECYETIEAIEAGDDAHLREELGDLLLQVVFHSRIAQESKPGWGIEEVASGIVDKLIRRHPHVFADAVAADADSVAANWTLLKAKEKSRTSAMDGVPLALPALALAQKSLRRAADFGAAGTSVPGASRPAGAEPAAGESRGDEAELAEQLWSLAVLAEQRGWDAEALLRERVRAFHRVVRAAESGVVGPAESGAVGPAESGAVGPAESGAVGPSESGVVGAADSAAGATGAPAAGAAKAGGRGADGRAGGGG